MADVLLAVRGLSKSYRGVPALRAVDLFLERGRTLALMGSSGSGKSTLARCIAGFETPDAGEILLEGRAAWPRAEVQLIPQQPAASLNPRFTAEELVAEPLTLLSRDRNRAVKLLEMVGLPRRAAGKRVMEFSGGERQRLALARALACEPKLLILDESLSGLDLSIQAQMANLLQELQSRLGLTCLLICHDPALARRLAHTTVFLERP